MRKRRLLGFRAQFEGKPSSLSDLWLKVCKRYVIAIIK